MNNGFLYATVLRYPEDGDVVIESLREADVSHLPLFHGIIRDVDVLGFDEKLVFSRDDKGLHVRRPFSRNIRSCCGSRWIDG